MLICVEAPRGAPGIQWKGYTSHLARRILRIELESITKELHAWNRIFFLNACSKTSTSLTFDPKVQIGPSPPAGKRFIDKKAKWLV